MKISKLLIVISIFSSLLMGCGMKGPLYQTSEREDEKSSQAAEETVVNKVAKNQQSTEANITDIEKPPAVTEEKPANSGISALKATQTDNEATTKTESFEFLTARAQLLAIAPAHFTLQLAAMTSKDSLLQFAAEHNLPQKEVYIYQTIRAKQIWYVVIFGEYASKQAAESASKKLPGSFANMDSWVRSYQLVHQDLHLNNK
ncbi:MAG: SPOR domain-containing protein [Psychromonas sp.]|nr:SPOR domain-containing protein [Psychromonas sp.]